MFFLKDMKAGEEVALYVMERGDKIIDIKIVEVATNDWDEKRDRGHMTIKGDEEVLSFHYDSTHTQIPGNWCSYSKRYSAKVITDERETLGYVNELIRRREIVSVIYYGNDKWLASIPKSVWDSIVSSYGFGNDSIETVKLLKSCGSLCTRGLKEKALNDPELLAVVHRSGV